MPVRPVPVVLLFLLLAAASPAAAGDPSSVYLGLSDAAGHQVIIFGSEAIPPKLDALAASGARCPLLFLERRKAGPGDTGRQTAGNFNKLAGTVYQTEQTCVAGDRTVVLIDPDQVAGHRPVPVRPVDPSPLGKNDLARVEAARKRKTISSWRLAELGTDDLVALVVFAPDGNVRLASLVLIAADRLVFEDHKGSVKDPGSVWRVDDRGQLRQEDFSVLAAFRTSRGYEIVRAWSGPEGENAAVLWENGKVFSKGFVQYRYWAPL